VNYAQVTRYIEGTLIVDFVDAKTGRLTGGSVSPPGPMALTSHSKSDWNQ